MACQNFAQGTGTPAALRQHNECGRHSMVALIAFAHSGKYVTFVLCIVIGQDCIWTIGDFWTIDVKVVNGSLMLLLFGYGSSKWLINGFNMSSFVFCFLCHKKYLCHYHI